MSLVSELSRKLKQFKLCGQICIRRNAYFRRVDASPIKLGLGSSYDRGDISFDKSERKSFQRCNYYFCLCWRFHTIHALTWQTDIRITECRSNTLLACSDRPSKLASTFVTHIREHRVRHTDDAKRPEPMNSDVSQQCHTQTVLNLISIGQSETASRHLNSTSRNESL